MPTLTPSPLLTVVLWLALIDLGLRLWDRWETDPTPLIIVAGLITAVGLVYAILTGIGHLLSGRRKAPAEP